MDYLGFFLRYFKETSFSTLKRPFLSPVHLMACFKNSPKIIHLLVVYTVGFFTGNYG